MKLPQLVVDRRTKWLVFFLGGASTIILYQWTNRTHLYPPRLLEFSAVDKSMPFWPWSIWIYFTEYIIFPCAFFGLRNKENAVRYFYSYMMILLISIVAFILFPVTFPRADYPVLGSSISDQAVIFFRVYMDEPANCWPSLHVSSCYISAFCFWKESRKRFVFYTFWATLVAISTMTAKQHYWLDVWTAFLLTLACYYYCFYRLELYPRDRKGPARW